MPELLISCDYATCAVPEAHRAVFREHQDALTSPEGWDPGALNLAQALSMKFRTPLVHGDVTRLLIDFSQDGDARWSRLSEALPEATRGKLEDRHERPYRLALSARIDGHLQRGDELLHLMVRTLPAPADEPRLRVGRGAPEAERAAADLQQRLRERGIYCRLDTGEPISPLEQALRAKFRDPRYRIVALEAPQSCFLEGRPMRWDLLKKALVECVGATLASDVFNAGQG